MTSPSLQDLQAPIDDAIVDAMIASTPETWSHIVLTLVRPGDDHDVGHFTHELSSPTGLPPVTPDDSLFDATYRLDALFQRHGALLSRAVYEVHYTEGQGRFTASFEYANHPSVKSHP